jgi:hypothetical protein
MSMSTKPPIQQERAGTDRPKARLPENYEDGLIIRPCLPRIPGILGIGPDQCIASHPPHEPIKEHLHHQFHHMHIRYGFELPQQTLAAIREPVAPAVMMMIKADQRVDCNPIFVARGEGQEGICLHIQGEEVHWVHHDEAGEQATALYEATGRKTPEGYYWSGFYMSDVEEREIRRFSREELLRTIGLGLRADQHFQATWREPKDEPIEPYEVLICLTDDQSSYYTFFRLPIVVPLGPF